MRWRNSNMLAVKLTVVFPVGQPEAAFSHWLSHTAQSRFPHPMVIGVSPSGAHAAASAPPGAAQAVPVRRRSLFDDALQCLEQVATPYAVLLDSRDFVVASGLAELVRFLDRNAAYLCAGGLSVCYRGLGPAQDGDLPLPFAWAPGWSWPEPLWAEPASTSRPPEATAETWWAAFRPIDLRDATPRGRMAGYGESFCPLYGFVYRVAGLRTVLRRLASAGIDSALLAELMLGWESVARGRCRLERSIVSLVVAEERFSHYRDHRTANTHFLSPSAMDPFHRAVVRLGEDVALDARSEISIVEALSRGDLRTAAAEFRQRWSFGKASISTARPSIAAPATVAKPVEAVVAKDGGPAGPERYVETESENAIRATMGSYVYALARGELLAQPASSGQPFDFLRQQLTNHGLGAARISSLLAELAVIRQCIVGG